LLPDVRDGCRDLAISDDATAFAACGGMTVCSPTDYCALDGGVALCIASENVLVDVVSSLHGSASNSASIGESVICVRSVFADMFSPIVENDSSVGAIVGGSIVGLLLLLALVALVAFVIRRRQRDEADQATLELQHDDVAGSSLPSMHGLTRETVSGDFNRASGDIVYNTNGYLAAQLTPQDGYDMLGVKPAVPSMADDGYNNQMFATSGASDRPGDGSQYLGRKLVVASQQAAADPAPPTADYHNYEQLQLTTEFNTVASEKPKFI
jgi:cbb3-type cytochrome oxidase subunit 3